MIIDYSLCLLSNIEEDQKANKSQLTNILCLASYFISLHHLKFSIVLLLLL